MRSGDHDMKLWLYLSKQRMKRGYSFCIYRLFQKKLSNGDYQLDAHSTGIIIYKKWYISVIIFLSPISHFLFCDWASVCVVIIWSTCQFIVQLLLVAICCETLKQIEAEKEAYLFKKILYIQLLLQFSRIGFVNEIFKHWWLQKKARRSILRYKNIFILIYQFWCKTWYIVTFTLTGNSLL